MVNIYSMAGTMYMDIRTLMVRIDKQLLIYTKVETIKIPQKGYFLFGFIFLF